MKIKEVKLTDFRRFSNLTIRSIPQTAKLIVLLGRNGSGKSSVFDAFSLFSTGVKHNNCYNDYDNNYLAKIRADGTAPEGRSESRIRVEFYDCSKLKYGDDEGRKSFYFRSAYRFEEGFHMDGLRRQAPLLSDEEDPCWMVARDKRVSANYQSMVSFLIEELSEPGSDNDVSRTRLRDKYIAAVQASMKRIFPDLNLESFGRPLQDGTFLFTKGASHNFPYKNLSGGEKAAFDLLLDFVIKTKDFNNTVFCIDEPELHMHSSLAGNLLEEMNNLIPSNCQLWIATHSLGMIRKAKELYEANPESVVFLDFSNRDFDAPQIVEPIVPTRTYWKSAFEVALGDMVSLIAPKRIFLCEGQRREQGARRNPNFDARCYNQIFEREFPDVQFISVGGCNDVDKNALIAGSVLKECVSGVKIETIYDCDDRSSQEVADLVAQGGRVLTLRDLENYLWNDEVLGKLCHVNQHDELLSQLLATKNQLMVGVTPPDDVKSIAGPLYNAVKSTLGLTKCGNTHEAFARDTLAPLIEPGMSVYAQLKKDIFGV